MRGKDKGAKESYKIPRELGNKGTGNNTGFTKNQSSTITSKMRGNSIL